MKSLSVTIQMKATEQYFLLVLFILVDKVVQTEILCVPLFITTL